MVIFLGLRWWYSDGFIWIFNSSITHRVKKWVHFFSMQSLLKTLFAPFKQDIGRSNRSGFDALVQSIVNNSVSRIFGFIARSFLLIAGVVCISIVVLTGILMLLIWPIIPVLPVVSIVLAGGATL